MQCEQARQLFDAYLDGEMSSALATELAAHRVRCSDCRRALALLEVSGEIISSDRDEVSLRDDFSSRLLACMDTPQSRWRGWGRYAIYYAGPLAAAAVIALAFIGVFDRSNGAEVLGEKVENRDAQAVRPVPEPAAAEEDAANSLEAEHALDEWIGQAGKNWQDRRESAEEFHKALDLTIGQWLDILEEANDTSSPEDHFPGANATGEPSEGIPTKTESVDIVD
jgi:hypothetical protein